MGIFYFFAALLLLQALVSLRGGARYLRYFRRELSAPTPGYAPFATVVVPCRGLEQGLRENLHALCQQNYPAFEIIFVVDSADDPASQVIEEVRRACGEVSSRPTRMLAAGAAIESGQKV